MMSCLSSGELKEQIVITEKDKCQTEFERLCGKKCCEKRMMGPEGRKKANEKNEKWKKKGWGVGGEAKIQKLDNYDNCSYQS